MPSFWKNRGVLVTGATGFLGRWTVERLALLGAKVTGVARSVPQHLNDACMFYAADVRDCGALGAILDRNPVQTIFHLAGQSIMRAVEKHPVLTLETNVQGTWNVLQAALEHDVHSVVAVSSASLYAPASEPLRETDPLEPSSAYAASKACSDTLLTMYASAYGLRTAIARFANIFGGGDQNESRLIPGAIRSTLAGERLQLRCDGNVALEFLYIEDAVQALLTLGQWTARGSSPAGEAYNFGLEHTVSVLTAVRRILCIAGREDLAPVIPATSPAAHSCRLLNCEKARRVLGWTPRFTFDQGLHATFDWYRTYSKQIPEAQAVGAGR